MANKDLKLRPYYIHGNPDVWWYEEPQGIYIVNNGTTRTARIRWAYLKAALARKEKD